jgi:FAD linked oxidases, C-terminal domain
LIRSPWLEMAYGKEVVDLFKDTKDIFDPKNIFNPHKKPMQIGIGRWLTCEIAGRLN